MDWIKRVIIDPLKEQMQSGMTPEKLALSFAVGITCGVVRECEMFHFFLHEFLFCENAFIVKQVL